MHPILSSLSKIFDQFPEPVFWLDSREVLYENTAGRALHPHQTPLPPDLFHREFTRQDRIALAGNPFWVDLSPLEDGRLLILHAQNEGLTREQVAMGRLAEQMRDRLNTLTATTESLASSLKQTGDYQQYQRPLAVQLQSIYRMLHLAKQMELLHLDWSAEYPLQPLDLSNLCAHLTQEAADLADICEVNFLYECRDDMVPVRGSATLLKQMLLSLIANSVRAAGPGGRMGLRLAVRRDQAQIAIWDSGPGIPPQQLEQLFHLGTSRRLPSPGEGAQLGLYLAREIALYHGGALLSSNRQEAGAELLISLPLYQGAPLNFRSPDPVRSAESFAPTLVALSDALPWQVFAHLLGE